jgi:hypothetical protein
VLKPEAIEFGIVRAKNVVRFAHARFVAGAAATGAPDSDTPSNFTGYPQTTADNRASNLTCCAKHPGPGLLR